MYGVVTAIPRRYLIYGGDGKNSRNIDVKEINNYDGPMEFKLKIKSNLVPLFIDCEDCYSRNRERAIDALLSSEPSFKKWYDDISNAGKIFSGFFIWPLMSYFYIGLKLEIFFSEDDIECLE